MKKVLLIFSLAISIYTYSQKEILVKEVVIESQRIDLAFSKNSHSITLISSQEIEHSSANNLTDLLQQEAGIDIRRRGIDGMQSDIYIRGGSFEQVLILIDGIKTDDAQTGHHTMNMMLPLEIIERIEIVKGPAARIYGQNAFTGAINIVTKKILNSNLILKAGTGSFGRLNGEITGILDLKKISFQAHYSKNYSKGYRFNTDFDNDNFFLKTSFKTSKNPINLLATFSEKKFGANGFYASPAYKNQYEETQTSLVGISTKFTKGLFTFKPQVYWKRNQDNYFFLRQNPSFFENFHITNKIGAQFDTKLTTKIGITGAGVEFTQTYLSSNNLGKRQRTTANLFVEHRFEFFKKKLDITPGIALSYYSDFKFHAFPGLDVGFKINNNFKLFGNIGYTYRIPTYTDLYYNSPSTLGNINLKPETALTEELGIKFQVNKFNFSLAGFNRDAQNLIDYTKKSETDKFQANNIRKVNTKGIDANISYQYKMLKKKQHFKIGYTFLYDNLKGLDVPFSRYTLNSARNQLNASIDFSLLKDVRHFISYKYTERTDGTSYTVLDAKISFKIKQVEVSGIINNILNTKYTETNLVPMPERNLMLSIKYNMK